MNRLKTALALATVLCITFLHSYAQTAWKMQPVGIQTRWAKDVTPDNVLPDYPRPQMVRNEWQNLNGLWEYAIMPKGPAMPSEFDGQILVPFPLESALSGVKKPLLPNQLLWYKRSIAKPDIKGGKRVMLHFGAVDYQATVFINGKEIGGHTGGYQNFSFDITDVLKAGNNELLVKVWDPTDQGPNPHGKQVLKPQNIMYTATSGIWQTVWMETVPAAHISNLVMTPSIDSGHLRLSVNTAGNAKDYTIEAVASNGSSVKGKPGAQLLLPVNNAHLWSPEDPYLYNLTVRLLFKGKVIDTVGSYFGMRKIEVKNDDKGVARLFLNNKYTYRLGVLDQGFWPEGLYTAPTDEALKFDILAIKNMGYNTIRKHIKLEPARWYYHADQIGMLVWQDMVTCAGDGPDAHEAFEKENKENIAQLHNYPSIVIWVLFNEGWARYDQQRLTEWMKKADPSRVIDGHTGENYDRGSPQNPMDKWVSSDMTDIHDYPGPGIAPSLPGKARILGEWGGVRVVTPKHQWNGAEGWGYIQVTPAEFAQKYEFMLKHLKVYEEEGLSGSIYTEPFDVETEENGMMSYDREVIKIPAEKLRQIHRSLVPAAESYAWSGFKAMASDTTNPDRQYATLLQEYKQGKKDSAFLHDLAMMALRVNDKASASMIASDYIKGLQNPFTKTNMAFIQQFTLSSKDPGFQLFLKQPEKVDQVIGAHQAVNKVMGIIFVEEISAKVSGKDANPDWNALEKSVVSKYGAPGEEIVWRAKTIHCLNRRDWSNFAATATPYIEKYGMRVSPNEMNSFAWTVFENVSDKEILTSALSWSKRSFQHEQDPNYIDTYANLLYKLDKKEEAITWEQKALNLAPDNAKPTFQATLDKMKSGENTWK
jgi:tetratricopeptide (TPR) repeat protein